MYTLFASIVKIKNVKEDKIQLNLCGKHWYTYSVCVYFFAVQRLLRKFV